MTKKRTKVVCTLGPACDNKDMLRDMVDAGMNVARLNFSHGSYENHKQLMTYIREVATETKEPIAILQDLQGPKIRVGVVPESGVVLTAGETVIFDTALDTFTENRIPIDYHELHQFLQPKERLFLSDGKIETTIMDIDDTRIHAMVVAGGTIFSHKGINVPDSRLHIRAMTEKDKQDAKFGVQAGVDMIALSFVMSPEDILDLRYVIKEAEKELGISSEQPIKIIAKIERNEAVEHIEAILDVVDGIMIARGDLGIEIPAEKVPIVQKQLIDKAREKAKPVIVATQMLDSMQENPRPTRAEVSDVANAVMDHTDAVMLSNETATGKYPLETVTTMTNIILEAEKSVYDNLPMKESNNKKQEVDEVLSGLSRLLAEEVGAKIILAASISGETGRMISRFRPELSIAVATSLERTQRQLNLSWGVHPFVLLPCKTIEELVERSVVALKEHHLVRSGDKIIVVAGEPVGQAGHVNLLEVRDVD